MEFHWNNGIQEWWNVRRAQTKPKTFSLVFSLVSPLVFSEVSWVVFTELFTELFSEVFTELFWAVPG
jgi:hypothetical protein